mmetsp:Transcript_34497/g.75848  ORF Transcript_34497/g.75848 Transcript_34497/m.75848 type:complete len:458 (+) Transcript_34497:246-1619(+)
MMTPSENKNLLPSHRSSYQNGTGEDGAEGEASVARLRIDDSFTTNVAWSYSTRAALLVLAAVIVAATTFVGGIATITPTSSHSDGSTAAASMTATESNSLTLDSYLPILGKSKKKRDKANECESDDGYSKHTVKTAYELPFAALFRENKGQKKFEASSVTIVGNDVYSVCDSSFAIAKFDSSLLPFSPNNVQIGSPDRDGDQESGYEAIFHHEGTFYVVRESILHHNHDDNEGGDEDKDAAVDEKHSYNAVIEELLLGDTDYTVKSQCSSEFEFEGASKGFEGAVGFADANGELFIIGLCEGNHCSESRKADAGNGRVVIMKKKEGDDVKDGCMWETLRVVKIPKSAYFIDYSAIDITDSGRVVISSQENSAVWLGTVNGIENGVIDPDAFSFNEDEGKTLQFPKSTDCHTVYCNIEGIHFINDEMLLAVSDKMKGHGKQDFRCFEKDQSIHAMVLP